MWLTSVSQTDKLTDLRSAYIGVYFFTKKNMIVLVRQSAWLCLWAHMIQLRYTNDIPPQRRQLPSFIVHRFLACSEIP